MIHNRLAIVALTAATLIAATTRTGGQRGRSCRRRQYAASGATRSQVPPRPEEPSNPSDHPHNGDHSDHSQDTGSGRARSEVPFLGR